MIRSRLGLRALMLSGLVLGLMAFAYSGVAQAEPGACWGYINPSTGELKCFSTSLEPTLNFALENNTGSLLFKTKGGTSVTILCTTAEFAEGGQLSANGSILLGRALFKNCVTLLNGVLSTKCKPSSPGKPAASGELLTRKGDALLVLHKLASGELDPLVLILPDEGTILQVIELGETCAIGETVKVEGHWDIWDCKGRASFETHAVTHLLEESTLHLLTALGQPATISGSFNVSLGGAHAGYLWAGLPG